MAKIVVWNNKASVQFEKVIDYLQNNWGDKITQRFVAKTYQIIEIITKNPEIGILENHNKRVRVFVITKHNTLFYRIDGNKIFLLNFFDNRQHPKKRSDM